jgi:TMEM175 potassium channel family protein
LKHLYPRGEEEFGRVLTFSDGVYAIAMTLLVVGIDLPNLHPGPSGSDLLEALGDTRQQIVSYAISFAVIGRYWVAHHQFYARLRALDSGLIALNLVSLGVVAFLPFPTDVLGNYFENPVSIIFYALTVALVSGLEVAMFSRAHRQDLLDPRITEEIYRWERASSTAPVIFFLLSLPLAFVRPELSVLLWFAGIPYQLLYLNRHKPAGAEELLG